MKTYFYTCLGLDVNRDALTKGVLERAYREDQSLPIPVQHEKLFQAFLQCSLDLDPNREFDEPGDGFFIQCLETTRNISLDDPTGSMTVRVDYDAKHSSVCGMEPYEVEHEVFNLAMLALAEPNSRQHFSRSGAIDHIRVSIVVEPGIIIERTYWPVMYLG